MAAPINKVLIIDGGFSGMAAAIELRKHGIDVELLELNQDWRSYGAGNNMAGASMCVQPQPGVMDAFMEESAASNSVDGYIATGCRAARLPTPSIAGHDVPGDCAIMRASLARILADVTRASGTHMRRDADGARRPDSRSYP
ncbi:FAD-dependent monooxygenase [Telluria mixta]|uniref:FAD-dependent monooxygenase n=1 Tax=Telluria mixta TaxID=34071 RepID=A0ABT2BS15_9BURK|nr:FAD-dependent monooxygenase [Telluria mixta]MCS0627912.1 FAD-dependent monooxygenase [Telluria mixta]WEM93969.1 FAD-dependent monooxygenase [Telluria mixta]